MNHNLSLFSQTTMMVLVTPHLPANSFPLVSQLMELKMTFSSDHIKHLFKSSAHQVLFWFCLLFLSQFLEAHPVQTLNIFPSKHFCPVPHPGNSQIPCNSSPPSVPMVPTQPGTVQSWCEEVEGERGNLQSSEKPEKCEGGASNICGCLWAPTCCLTASPEEQE